MVFYNLWNWSCLLSKTMILYIYDDISKRFTPPILTAQWRFYYQMNRLVELFHFMYLTLFSIQYLCIKSEFLEISLKLWKENFHSQRRFRQNTSDPIYGISTFSGTFLLVEVTIIRNLHLQMCAMFLVWQIPNTYFLGHLGHRKLIW